MMSQTIFSVRMDEQLKKQFDSMCADFGMNASVAFNVFARAVVRERRIPFEIVSAKQEVTRADGMQVFLALREEAKAQGLQDMSLEEINAEINESRKNRD
jgi:addiction module RelB/DinJ family antitoxin